MPFIDIATGIALILFGVRFLREGLDRLFGKRLITWLTAMTENRYRAFLGGTVIGVFAPSSTGLSIWAAQTLGSGQLTAPRLLAVVLGANLGWTVIIQILSFRLHTYAGLFIIAGVLGFQFLSREVYRALGQCLLAIGLLFFAVQIISHGAGELTQAPEITQLFLALHEQPFLVVFMVTLMTVILQSSSAAFGVAIGLVSSGLLDDRLLVIWVLGANLGLATTMLIIGWHHIEGRQLGIGNLVAKLLVALPLLALPVLTLHVFHILPGDILSQMVWFHTLFNLAVGLLALPLLGPIQRFSEMLAGAFANGSRKR